MNLRHMAPGRPVRFIYLVLSLWIAGRAGILLTQPNGTKLAISGQAALAQRGAGTDFEPAPRAVAWGGRPIQPVPTVKEVLRVSNAPNRTTASADPAERALLIAAASAPPERTDRIFNRSPGLPPMIARLNIRDPSGRPDRWSLSAWMLYRPDNRQAGLASGGQLGASQVGARLAYDLAPSAAYSLAIHGRASSALDSPIGAEAALGLTLRPARSIPVALSIERRVAMHEGGRNAFAVYAAGGIGPMPVVPGVELEGYAQAGVVGAARTDGFADGRIAVAGKLLESSNGVAITAGVAFSGGAQPSLSRLDIGPQLSALFPFGGGFARAALEWRERVVGGARPASGPAFVLAANF